MDPSVRAEKNVAAGAMKAELEKQRSRKGRRLLRLRTGNNNTLCVRAVLAQGCRVSVVYCSVVVGIGIGSFGGLSVFCCQVYLFTSFRNVEHPHSSPNSHSELVGRAPFQAVCIRAGLYLGPD